MMKLVNVTPGTAPWHGHRARHFGASEVGAMLNCSPHTTRNQLLQEKKLGRPDPTAAKQRILESGHVFEAWMRPGAEEIIGDDLAPLVGAEGELSASFDGIDFDWSVTWEHKRLNDALRECMPHAGRDSHTKNDGAALPKYHRGQCEQQLRLSGAKRCLFSASLWSDDGTLIEERHAWYYPDDALWAEIRAGWTQFARDLAAYIHVEEVPKAIPAPPPTLPALVVQLEGKVLSSNLPAFKAAATAMIAAVKTTLEVDQDFVDAAATIKAFDQGEKSLALVKQQALAGTADLASIFSTIDEVSALMRQKRLQLNSLVEAEKKNRKSKLVLDAADALAAHIRALPDRTRQLLPSVPADWAGAISGMSSLASMRNALDSLLATKKIEVNTLVERVEANLATIDRHPEHRHLFADVAQLAVKDTDAVEAIVAGRITEAKAAEERRLEAERQRIRQEEEARAAAIARQQEAERQAAKSRAQREQEEAATKAAALARVAEAGKAAEWPQAGPQNPVQAPTAPAANTTPMQQLRAAAAPLVRGEPTLRLGDLCARFGPGVTLTAAYLEARGFPPARRDRNAALFHEEDVPAICDAIAAHVMAVKHAHQQKAA
jgi:predicted phage-related endonuclease